MSFLADTSDYIYLIALLNIFTHYFIVKKSFRYIVREMLYENI